MTDVYVRGSGRVVFARDDFMSAGGQAKVYKKGNIAYKVFHSTDEMIPEAKIQELQVLDNPHIIKPLDILLTKDNIPVGFTSSWVNGISICKVFVTGFRKRNSITDNHTLKLVKNIAETTSYIHRNNCIVRDGNQLNYLVSSDWVTPYFIDVNAWKTPSYPADAIMSTVRDWLNPDEVSELADWYAFAVLSFWLFVGVHPYMGNHPNYKQKNIEEMIKIRALDKVWALDSEVTIAPNARVNSIPNHYLDWYSAIFKDGVRCAPPDQPGVIVKIPMGPTIITGTNHFVTKEIEKVSGNIIWVSHMDGNMVIKTPEYVYINSQGHVSKKDTHITFCDLKQVPIFSNIVDGKLEHNSLTSTIRKIVSPDATELMTVGNHLFYRYGDKLVELEMTYAPGLDRIHPIAKTDWTIMSNSEIYAGVIFQNMLGNIYITIPIPCVNDLTSLIEKKIPELSKCKIIDAKHKNNVVAIFIIENNNYKILVLRFDEDYNTYDYREIQCSNIGDINMASLDNGTTVLIPEDGIIELFSNRPFANDVTRIQDDKIITDMRLCNVGNRAMFFQDNKLYTITMQ